MSSSGRARPTASSDPPTSTASVPSVAGPTDPATGASTKSMPCSSSALATFRAGAGPVVDMSMRRPPDPSPPARPSRPSTTSSSAAPSVSMVIATSALDPASAGDLATSARSASASACALARDQTTRSCPASERRPAMGAPIRPSPGRRHGSRLVCLRFRRRVRLRLGDPADGIAAVAVEEVEPTGVHGQVDGAADSGLGLGVDSPVQRLWPSPAAPRPRLRL